MPRPERSGPPETQTSVEHLWDQLEANGPMIGILMESEADRPVMEPAVAELDQRGITYEVRVVSAYRDPRGVAEYSSTAVLRGLRVIIAGGGMSAGLPGMVAAYTELPVVGVPIRSGELGGLDALLGVAQMPHGVPVGCMAVNGARNAAIYAAKILAQGSGPPVVTL
jgi:phosphoribosylaminoimidazole carboxylase PurE protein